VKQEEEAFDHLGWAKRPQSQNAWDLIVTESKVDPRFGDRREACRRRGMRRGSESAIRLELRGTKLRAAGLVCAGEWRKGGVMRATDTKTLASAMRTLSVSN
jgi:hypothetical protein